MEHLYEYFRYGEIVLMVLQPIPSTDTVILGQLLQVLLIMVGGS
nr:MAG TPA: hypothetical protein [Caudoviricetes sp.]